MEDAIRKVNAILMRIRDLISETVEDTANLPDKKEAEEILMEIGKPLFLQGFEPDQVRRKILLDPDYIAIKIQEEPSSIEIERRWDNGVLKVRITNPDDIYLVTRKIIYAKLKKLTDPMLEKVGLKMSENIIDDNYIGIFMDAVYEVNGVLVNTVNCTSLKDVFREVAKEMAYAY